ncbi:MAG: GNAT family N-acetyltransferase [Bacteroidaceae bacterium]|nr:GNAT family N-acetyltransferase [Bacteroidaceae bacterium]
MNGNVRIFELKEVAEIYVEAINALLKQLSTSPQQFTADSLQEIISSSASHLFILECEEKPVGMLTLGEYLAPTGRKMWIEDVVVDNAFRGRSFGAMLVKHAIEFASSLGAGTLMLTSRPSRVAANALYRSCGFLPKETNMYKMVIGNDKD